jgi:hypothetical protein
MPGWFFSRLAAVDDEVQIPVLAMKTRILAPVMLLQSGRNLLASQHAG